jgi:CubicO group peptidase (beta-lactamase class C family)
MIDIKMQLLGLMLLLLLFCWKSAPVIARSQTSEKVHGFVKPGFEPVYEAFLQNFENGKEIGAALCIYHKGEKVIDIWGGYARKKEKQSWEENTLVLFFSATKGMAAVCLAKLHSEGKIDFNEKVSTYWPEFSKNGKEEITVSQLLSHQSGLCLWEGKLMVDQLSDRDLLLEKLENATPLWTPGDYSGYSAGLVGFYMSELVRRTDDRQRSLGQYFQDEIAGPLGMEFYIGLPDSVPDSRLAQIKLANPVKRIFTMGKLPKGLRRAILKPGSLFMKSITQIKGYNVNSRESLAFEEPGGNGVGTARSVALLYSIMATGIEELGIHPETLAQLKGPALLPQHGSVDRVMGIPLYYRNGFMKNGELATPFNNEQCFGFGGASGSMAFADPVNQIGYSYVPNAQGYDFPDGRDVEIQKVLYEIIGQLTDELE